MSRTPLALLLALGGCAWSNLPGAPPPPVLVMDITLGLRGPVDANLFYFIAIMAPEATATASLGAAVGATDVVVADLTGVLKDMPVTVSHATIADFVTSIAAIDVGATTVTLADALPEGAPVGALLTLGDAAGSGPWPAVSGVDRGLRWTRYLLWTGNLDLTGGVPDFMHGVGGTQVGAEGEQENLLLQPPQPVDLEDWHEATSIVDLNVPDVDTPVQNGVRFTVRVADWLAGDHFALQFLVASGGGIDQITNPPGAETGLVVDALDIEFVFADGLVEGYEIGEQFTPVEFPFDASPAAADIVWWEVSVR